MYWFYVFVCLFGGILPCDNILYITWYSQLNTHVGNSFLISLCTWYTQLKQLLAFDYLYDPSISMSTT